MSVPEPISNTLATPEEAAEPFRCTVYSVTLSGTACAQRHIAAKACCRRPKKESNTANRWAGHPKLGNPFAACMTCAAGSARADLLQTDVKYHIRYHNDFSPYVRSTHVNNDLYEDSPNDDIARLCPCDNTIRTRSRLREFFGYCTFCIRRSWQWGHSRGATIAERIQFLREHPHREAPGPLPIDPVARKEHLAAGAKIREQRAKIKPSTPPACSPAGLGSHILQALAIEPLCRTQLSQLMGFTAIEIKSKLAALRKKGLVSIIGGGRAAKACITAAGEAWLEREASCTELETR